MTELKLAELWDEDISALSKTFSSVEIIQQIQQNAIEASLELAAESAHEFDKLSILSLINHPKLKV